MKRLKHHEHGYHVPLNVEEERQMRKDGWVDDDFAELKAKLEALGAPLPDHLQAAPKRRKAAE